MELPLGGPALRHYTQSRPRPHRQKLNYRPGRTQETIIESENEVLELTGRVDEGVEEFFTKRVFPTDTLKTQDEDSITVHQVAPASSVPCPPQTKTLRRKLGDFFTLKKRRGLKSEPSQEGRPKKASIADFIRPLREVGRADKEKDKDRVREHDKENERERTKEHPSAVSGETADQETPVSGAPPLRGEAVPPRRALREGKSQSLILLSGSAAAGTTNARNTAKKQFEGQHSFEQKLHLMLQRIGVSKAHPGETQNQEGEMKKAESEGTIIDNKPEAPPTFTKARTMSASSDTRHQIRASVSAHESAGKPALLPKPVLKPGPPPTTSGRNTPENELAQIQEGESNDTPKQSPSASPCTPAAPTTPAPLTISDSAPDSTNFSASPSSTVSASHVDICTDFVNSTAAAMTHTLVTEQNDKPSPPEAKATTTELPTTSSPTTITSPATPTEFPTTVSLTSTPCESITPSTSVTSNSAPITAPSITTPEAVSPPDNESPVFTTSATPSTKSPSPELISADATPDAGDDAASVMTTDSLPSTSTSTATTSLVTESSDDSTSVTSASAVTLVPSETKTTSPPPDSSDYTVTPEPPIVSSSALASFASSTSTATTATSPPSTDHVDSVSSSASTHPAMPSSADISAPSTSSSETNFTDTTTTTTSLNRADTTSTTSSATAAAISSSLQTDPDPAYTNDDGTTPTQTSSGLPTTDNSSAAPQHFAAPAPSSQTSPEERSCLEPAEKGTADEELDVVQTSKQMEAGESKRVSDFGTERENEKDESASVDSKEIREEVSEESVKEAVEIEVGVAEPASGQDGELYSNEGVMENHKQGETKSVHEN